MYVTTTEDHGNRTGTVTVTRRDTGTVTAQYPVYRQGDGRWVTVPA